MYHEPFLLAIFVLLFGLCIGSFLNVVIYRIPQMMQSQCTVGYNLCFPASHCPHCQTSIHWLDNIPVLSWLLLGGRCRHCDKKISIQYPLIELLTGGVTLAVVFLYPLSAATLGMLLLVWGLIALAVIDYQTYYLPDILTQPLLWLGLLFSLQGCLNVDLPSALLGACAGYVSLWLLNVVMRLISKKESMGYGDFKLFAVLGAWFGWQMLPSMALIAALTGIIATLIKQRNTLNSGVLGQPLAFGPYLVFSGIVMLIIHSPLFMPWEWSYFL